jgi:alpha-tubulin suppressor-like RCC1 family protein
MGSGTSSPTTPTISPNKKKNDVWGQTHTEEHRKAPSHPPETLRIVHREENDEIDNMIRSLSINSPREEGVKSGVKKRVCEVYTGGSNSFGQLGIDLVEENTQMFTKVDLGRRVRFVACGEYHTIIISERNEIFTAGHNHYGQCGIIETCTPRRSQNIKYNKKVVEFFQTAKCDAANEDPIRGAACGAYHSILWIGSSLYGCGKNDNGQLGSGDILDKFLFTKISLPNELCIKQIACGSNHTAILTDNYKIFITGSNEFGQLGLEQLSVNLRFVNVFTLIPFNIDIVKVACGNNYTMILTLTDLAYGCGINDQGQLGISSNETQNSLKKVEIFDERIKDLYCGAAHSILVTDSDIYVVGANEHGQLGLDSVQDHTTPVILPNHFTDRIPKGIACNHSRTTLVYTSDDVLVVGDNSEGQLGIEDRSNVHAIEKIQDRFLSTCKILSVSTGSKHTVLVVASAL